jgi:hypothetical protein
MTTRIFFDTEFTSLVDPRLISIGLVEESGTLEYYAEVDCREYGLINCSAFCVQEVLPNLCGGEFVMTTAGLRVDLAGWLHERGKCVLVSDSWRDACLLCQLFRGDLPQGTEVQMLGIWGNLKRRVKNRGRRIHVANGLRVHHALDDARANWIALSAHACWESRRNHWLK